MNKRDQKRFVRELMQTVRQSVFDNIDRGKIPEEWDGHELRQFLRDKFSQSGSSIMQDKGNQRRRNYDNHVLTTNL
jgi:hypothetical protein